MEEIDQEILDKRTPPPTTVRENKLGEKVKREFHQMA